MSGSRGCIYRVAAAFLLAASSWAAQTTGTRNLSLLTGKGELLEFQSDVQRVAVAEPKVADAVVVSPHEVMINAKGPGRTTIVIWESGSIPRRYEVTVADDSSDESTWWKDLLAAAGPAVEVRGNLQTVVLTGKVRDAAESKKLAALASTRARNVVNLLETPPAPEPRQVLLQVKFASIDRVALSELGFNYFSTNDKTLGAVSTQQFQAPRFSQFQLQEFNLRSTTINFADLLNLFAFRPDLNIGATIKALAAKNLLQILAEPNLITLEGKEASFLAGGEFPFPTLTSTSTGGAVAPVITVQFKKFGIQLSFTPTLEANGTIHLKVAPEVSALDFSNAVTLQGVLIPAISSRRAETEVLLKDGESFAIAGLIDNRVVQTLNRVRGLGDIPIVGQLFRSRSTRRSTDELLVVVTPRFVRPLSPEEKANLPDMIEPFLPSVAEQKAAQAGKKAKKKPEFVGPRGHQEPK